MSHRDYANRRPQSGAKPRPIRATRARPVQKSAPRKKYPVALILFVILAVGCFSYFLWSIKDTAKQQTTATTPKTESRVKVKETSTLTPKVKEAQVTALARLYEKGMISQAEYEDALREELRLYMYAPGANQPLYLDSLTFREDKK